MFKDDGMVYVLGRRRSSAKFMVLLFVFMYSVEAQGMLEMQSRKG